VIDPAQLSVAVGAVNVSTLHSAVTSARVATSATGAVVSTTVIVCVYVLALPLTVCSRPNSCYH
jgi:predicted membrane-bound spermidine synthase